MQSDARGNRNKGGFSMVPFGSEEDSESWALKLESCRLNPIYTIRCITLGKLLRLSEFLFPHL